MLGHGWAISHPDQTGIGRTPRGSGGGTVIRQRLFAFPGERNLLEETLETLCPLDAKEFEKRVRTWPQILQTLVFAPNYTH